MSEIKESFMILLDIYIGWFMLKEIKIGSTMIHSFTQESNQSLANTAKELILIPKHFNNSQ